MRHTAATKLVEAGVSIKLVAEILGHTQVTTTELYTHITPESLRDHVDKL